MQKQYNVEDLQIDQKLIKEPFALLEFEKKLSKQMKPYYNIELGDKTGKIRAKAWTESIPNLDTNAEVGNIVAITGKVQSYADKPQIIVERLEVVDDIAPEEFLVVTERDRSQMADDLKAEIDKTQNQYLKQLLDLFWNNDDYRDKFINFPAGEYVHHGYVGGLIEHVWEMNELSKPYLKMYKNLDRDLLFTGIFFHDIGKLEELDIVGATIIRTVSGRLITHIPQGLLFVDHLIQQIPDFPEMLKDKVFHMILSHQGKLEFGSPVVPQLLEALVLSQIDDAGASMNQAVKHIEKEYQTGNEFTDYHKWLKRSFYQKDYYSDPNKTDESIDGSSSTAITSDEKRFDRAIRSHATNNSDIVRNTDSAEESESMKKDKQNSLF